MFCKLKGLFVFCLFIVIGGCSALNNTIYQDVEFLKFGSSDIVRSPASGLVKVVEQGIEVGTITRYWTLRSCFRNI
jgi:hypothetical protein